MAEFRSPKPAVPGSSPGCPARSGCVRRRQDVERVREWTDERAYAYLLGVYLGDGHIVGGGRLDIYLDAGYEEIIDEVARSMRAAYPGCRVRERPKTGFSAARRRQRRLGAGVSAARAGQKTRATNPARCLAARNRRSAPEVVPARTHSFRRLPMPESVRDQAAQRTGRAVLVSTVILLKSVGGHPLTVRRALRSARHPLVPVEWAKPLRLASRKCCRARRVHRPEELSYATRDASCRRSAYAALDGSTGSEGARGLRALAPE